MPHVASLGNDESVRRWFYRVLRNAAIDHHRRARSRSRALQALTAHLASAEAEPSEELDAELCRCMTSCPERSSRSTHTLQRIDLEGTAVKDYAAEVRISANNAAVRVFRPRKALRKGLVRACGTCAEHGCLECSCTLGTSGCTSEAS
jgi:RNA polymerase sigma factor (sigma-70 family)